MTNLWRGVAAAAILSAGLAACTSPHYPIRDDQTPGPAPLSAPEPKYPISQSAPPPAASAPAQTDAAAAGPTSPQIAAPVSHVESEALPPAQGAPAAASLGAPAAAEAPAGGDTPPTTTQPASPPPSPPPAPPAGGSDTSTPASTPAPPPSAAVAPASEPVITPRMVVHDQTSAPPPVVASKPIREAAAAPPPPPVSRHAAEHEIIAGDVVDAGDSIFENYQVQKGDHIDALARSFATTRKVLLDENKVRPPYLLRPGEILKVPVAKAYVAESVDTLSGVAKRFQVEVGELAQLNHLSERAALHDGQKIGLPSSMRDKGPIHLGGLNEYAYGEGSRPPQASSRVSSTMAPPAHPGLTPLNGSGQISQEHSGYVASPAQAPPPAQATPSLSDNDISAAAHGRFVWPVRGDIVARFGPMGVGRRNDGVDIKAAQGSVVKAAAPGEVVYAGDQVPGYGNLVLIKHADGWVTAYAHLDSVSVAMKDQVQQGQVVGEVGMTGGVSQPELHFEVRYSPTPADKARPVDPVLVLPAG